MSEARLHHDPERQRYELLVNGAAVGYVAYAMAGDAVRMTHTEIDAAHEGRGYASELARQTLDRLREEGGRVIPVCGFIAGFIERHPEYRDLVEGG